MAAVERATNTDMQTAFQVEKALLASPTKRRPMRVRSAEVGVPSVEVGVKVEYGDSAIVTCQGAENGQRDGVVAAKSKDSRTMDRSSVTADSTALSASVISNGLAATSPASATCW